MGYLNPQWELQIAAGKECRREELKRQAEVSGKKRERRMRKEGKWDKNKDVFPVNDAT